MKVPLLDLNRIHQPIRTQIDAAISSVLDSANYVLNENVSELETELSKYCNAKAAVGVASGTDALILALLALEIGSGDEVITTPYSFFSTVSSIVRVGATPVFVDIYPDTYNMAVDQVKSVITNRTRAIMPIHLFGQPADMGTLLEVAKHHDLAIIEDGAQAIGSLYKGNHVLGIGDIGCLSFFPSKNLGGIGDGGMVFCKSKKLENILRQLRVHGTVTEYHHQTIGINSRLDEIQAAVLRVKLPLLDRWCKQRRRNASLYTELFEGSSIITPIQHPDCYHVYNQYVIRAPNRDKTLKKLHKEEIGCSVYYPVPLHLQECFKFLNYTQGDFPESEKASKETLALPIFSGLTEQEIEHVARVVLSVN